MASKKDLMTRPEGEYPPRPTYNAPKVTVSLIEPGSRLDLAAKTKSLDAATPAEVAEVEFHREKLQPSILAAKDAQGRLAKFETVNKEDLALLRGFNFDGVRGRWPDDGKFEATRVRAEHAVLALFSAIHGSHTEHTSTAGLRDILPAIEKRVASLGPKDMRGARMNSDLPGIRTYGELPPAEVERIRLDVAAAVRHVDHLGRVLDNARGAVADLIAAVERKKAQYGETAAITATVVNPNIAQRDAVRDAARPSEGLRAISDFSPYQHENENEKN